MNPKSCMVIFGWTWLLMTAGCAEPSLDPMERAAAAEDHYEAGRFDFALTEVKKALSSDPDNARARLVLGRLYLDTGHPAKAEVELLRSQANGAPANAAVPLIARALLNQQKFDKVLRSTELGSLSPSAQAELLSTHALAHLGLGQKDGARATAEQALETDPGSAFALTVEARLDAIDGNTDKARSTLQQVVQQSPDFAPAWSLLGDLAVRGKRLHEAEQAFSRAIENRVNNAKDLIKRTLVRIDLGDNDGAAADIQQLKTRFPKLVDTAFLEGRLAFARKDFAEARELLRRAEEYRPDDGPTLFFLGSALFMLGNYGAAEPPLQRHLAQSPGAVSTRKLLALIHIQRGDYARAKGLIETVRRDKGAKLILATLLTRQGQPDRAIALLSQLVEEHPDDFDAHMRLGTVQFIGDKLAEAIGSLERAIKLKPKNEKPYMLLTKLYLQQKEFSKALATAQRLQAQVPDSATALNMLGSIHLAKGEKTAAAIAFREAAERRPGDPFSHHQLALMAIAEKDPESARKHHEAVLKHHKDHLATLISLAELEDSLGDIQALKAVLQRTVESHPGVMQPYLDLARLYLSKDDPGHAQATLTQAGGQFDTRAEWLLTLGQVQRADGDATGALLTFDKLLESPQLTNTAQVHYLEALCYGQLGQTSAMAEALDRALEADPSHGPARLSRAQLMLRQGRVDPAESELELLEGTELQNDPETVLLRGRVAAARNHDSMAETLFRTAFEQRPTTSALLALAQQVTDMGRAEEGMALLTNWLEQHPWDRRALRGLANAYRGLGRTDDALKTYEQILAIEPDDADALNGSAWLLRQRNPSKALAYARQANLQAPDSPDIKDTLAMVAWAAGQPELAHRTFVRGITSAPDHPGLRVHYAQLLAEQGDSAEAVVQLRRALSTSRSFVDRAEAETLLERLASGL